MRSLLVALLFLLLILGIDLYVLRGIHHLLPPGPERPLVLITAYGSLTTGLFSALLWSALRLQGRKDPSLFGPASVFIGLFLMVYVPKLCFSALQLLSDIVMLGMKIAGFEAQPLREILLWVGATGAGFLFLAFGLGMIRGRTRLKIFRVDLRFPKLPAGFKGMKVVQLSDLHLAGFYRNRRYVERVVNTVNRLEPQLLLFTGDMVHNFSEELDPFVKVLKRLRAPLGKFAVLGNHDYGHYFRWRTPLEEEENLEQVKRKIRQAGFDLLLNEFRTLSYRGDEMELIGVENWGSPPFPQNGDLEKAMQGTVPGRFRILMSHDPSHWDRQVRGNTEIPLTLSGHTHGMQFGFEIGRFRWSPSRWKYRQWAGLYRNIGQYLYVNRGLGYTGFPGRVGIRPEITLLTLH